MKNKDKLNTENKVLNPLIVKFLNDLDQKDFVEFLMEVVPNMEQIDYENELHHFRSHGWSKHEMPEPTVEEFIWRNSEQLLEKYQDDLNEKFEEYILHTVLPYEFK